MANPTDITCFGTPDDFLVAEWLEHVLKIYCRALVERNKLPAPMHAEWATAERKRVEAEKTKVRVEAWAAIQAATRAAHVDPGSAAESIETRAPRRQGDSTIFYIGDSDDEEFEDAKTTLDADEDAKTSWDADEDAKTSLYADEDAKTTLDADEDAKTSWDADEDAKTSWYADEDAKTTLDADEDAKTSWDADEDAKTSLYADEDAKTSLYADEDTKTSLDADEDAKTSCNADEDAKTSLYADEDAKTSLYADEDAKTSLYADEDAKTSLDADEDTKTSLDADEDAKSSLDADEGAKTSLDADEGAKTSLDAKEDAKTTLDSGEGAVALDSGEGAAALDSGEGATALDSGKGTAALVSGEGATALDSGEGATALDSGEGAAVLVSGEGATALDSGEGAAALVAGEGATALDAGEGGDAALSAGECADTVLYAGEDADTTLDFSEVDTTTLAISEDDTTTLDAMDVSEVGYGGPAKFNEGKIFFHISAIKFEKFEDMEQDADLRNLIRVEIEYYVGDMSLCRKDYLLFDVSYECRSKKPDEGTYAYEKKLELRKREIEVYTKLFPKLEDLIFNVVNGEVTELGYPSCFFGFCESGDLVIDVPHVKARFVDAFSYVPPPPPLPVPTETESRSILILHDLRKMDFVPKGQDERLTLLEAHYVIREIAQIHATSWVLQMKTPQTPLLEIFPFLLQPREAVPLWVTRCEEGIDDLLIRLKNRLGPDDDARGLLQRLDSYRGKFTETFFELTQPPEIPCPSTLIHLDLQLGNILFRYEDEVSNLRIENVGDAEMEIPDADCRISNWKIASIGSPMHDIAFLLLTSLPLEIRREHTSELIEYYQYIFKITANRMDFGIPFSWKDLRKDYDRSLLFALLMVVGNTSDGEHTLNDDSLDVFIDGLRDLVKLNPI